MVSLACRGQARVDQQQQLHGTLWRAWRPTGGVRGAAGALSRFFEVDVSVGSTLLGRSGDDGVEMMIVAQYPRSGHDPLV